MKLEPERADEIDREQVRADLQAMLTDLLDLSLIGKHARWNVGESPFRLGHRELDELVDAWRVLADEVAERSAAVGGSPDWCVQTLARSTQIQPLRAGHLR